jgi:hypothetical protein
MAGQTEATSGCKTTIQKELSGGEEEILQITAIVMATPAGIISASKNPKI